MKRKISIVLVLAMCLIMAGCGEKKEVGEPQKKVDDETQKDDEQISKEVSADNTGEVAKAGDIEKMLICCVAGEVGIPYFTTMQWGALQAGKDLGVDVYWTGPPDWDVGAQINFVDGCLAKNPAGLMICPADSESYVAYAEKWMKSGIGVVCADSVLAKHTDLVGLESNNFSGGAEAAKYMFEVNGKGGTYLPLGSSIGSYSTERRIAGFKETMNELNPTAVILDSVYCEYESTRAAELVSATIMANQELSGVFCASSAAATGAASAVIEAGKAGKVKLAAFDADPQQIEDLRSGIYDVVIAQDPYQMGYDAVEILVKYAKGELTADDFPDPIRNYPTKAIHKGNVDDPECDKYKYIPDVAIKGF